MTAGTHDWHAWHEQYDDPASSLSRRLEVVREQLRGLLSRGADGPAPRRLVSLCAGDGRDTLPVLAETGADVDAVLVEIDPELAGSARATARELGLGRVEVRIADAGVTDSYAGADRADVLLACGVFGNVSDDDVAVTIARLPSLLAPGGHVVWTRGNRVPLDPTGFDGDPSELVRSLFAVVGFEEVAFVRPDDAGFRVGVHRWPGEVADLEPGVRMFSFV